MITLQWYDVVLESVILTSHTPIANTVRRKHHHKWKGWKSWTPNWKESTSILMNEIADFEFKSVIRIVLNRFFFFFLFFYANKIYSNIIDVKCKTCCFHFSRLSITCYRLVRVETNRSRCYYYTGRYTLICKCKTSYYHFVILMSFRVLSFSFNYYHDVWMFNFNVFYVLQTSQAQHNSYSLQINRLKYYLIKLKLL